MDQDVDEEDRAEAEDAGRRNTFVFFNDLDGNGWILREGDD